MLPDKNYWNPGIFFTNYRVGKGPHHLLSCITTPKLYHHQYFHHLRSTSSNITFPKPLPSQHYLNLTASLPLQHLSPKNINTTPLSPQYHLHLNILITSMLSYLPYPKTMPTPKWSSSQHCPRCHFSSNHIPIPSQSPISPPLPFHLHTTSAQHRHHPNTDFILWPPSFQHFCLLNIITTCSLLNTLTIPEPFPLHPVNIPTPSPSQLHPNTILPQVLPYHSIPPQHCILHQPLPS